MNVLVPPFGGLDGHGLHARAAQVLDHAGPAGWALVVVEVGLRFGFGFGCGPARGEVRVKVTHHRVHDHRAR